MQERGQCKIAGSVRLHAPEPDCGGYECHLHHFLAVELGKVT